MAKNKGISKIAMWTLMGLLMISLVGFGAINLGGNIRTVGSVGDKPITVNAYAQSLQQEIQSIERQTRQRLPFAQVQAIGLDRAVLQRLVRDRALDHEASQMGLSVGDEAVAEQIRQIPAFQGIDGNFDRDGYRQTLRQNGQDEAEFETSLREQAARGLLQGAILGGVRMPHAYAKTLVDYVGEERALTWARLDEASLTTPLPVPTDAQLQAFYDENAARFMLLEAKEISFIWLRPEDLTSDLDLPEDELRKEYANRAEEYDQPERRLVERLVFADDEAANQAAANIEVGGTDFAALVETRGLSLSDVDLGDVSQDELGQAGEGVFAAASGDIVGPLPSTLGPALFRINAILPEVKVSFEEALPDLRHAVAAARAVRAVEVASVDMDDQLAGGATLEQMAEETEAHFDTIIWTPEEDAGIAAYGAFRQAAASVQESDFAQITLLSDGGVFALRLDAELPERPNPFEAAKDDVRIAWVAEQTVAKLRDMVKPMQAKLEAGDAFVTLGLEPRELAEQTRDGLVPATPVGFMTEVFEMQPGEVRVLEGEDFLAVVRLSSITAAADDPENQLFATQLGDQMSQTLARDLFNIYADDVTSRAGPQIDQRALQAVHVNFP